MKKIDYSKLFTLRADGVYCASYTENGKRKWMYSRDPKNLYEKVQHRNAPKAVTVRKLAEEWEVNHQVGYKTAEAYRAPIRRLTEYIGDEAAEQVTAQEIQALLYGMGAQSFSRRTVQMQKDVCNMVFRYGVLTGRIKYNPCSSVTLPRNLKKGKRELPPDEAIEAVKRGVNLQFGLFAAICLYAGLRRGEALALRYEDIDRKRKVITVNKSVEFIGNNPHIKPPKTEAGYREVILLDVLAALIPKGRGYIFCRDDGEPLTKTQYRKRWGAYCLQIGYSITAHQLRHGFATILYEAGIPDKDAQELLGHSNITLTRNVYTHIRQTRKQETAAKLNAFVAVNVVASEKTTAIP